jgi:hypothetical protein
MKQVSPQTKMRPLVSHSRILARGPLGDGIHGNSKEGRFLRDITCDLLAQVGGEPSFAQRLLVRRIAKAMLQLELLDARMSAGETTAHDMRAFSALSNQVRLGLRDIGLKVAPRDTTPTLAEYLAATSGAAE